MVPCVCVPKSTPEKLAYAREYRKLHRDRLLAEGRERNRSWYAANKERALTKQRQRRAGKRDDLAGYHREYAAKNREKITKIQRAWRARNVERERERQGARRATNPLEGRTRTQRHRAKKLGSEAHHTSEEMAARAELFGGVCAYCGGPWEQDDHAMPLAISPDDSAPNMVPSCSRCNRSKGPKDARAFIKWRLALNEPVTDYAVRFLASHDRYWIPAPQESSTSALCGVGEGQ